ncbi:hypothetical protein ATPR_0787 [Acetobacter tropicalis NBRC 101654]|uniref:Uncharacterized protein n=1 Tax=Acetobacter tropicalis NBRC 101654 TaxID=749388 RepID=F7VBN8_9PROT|nr:hypothetical protein ATPR_0787 [Acetobacter tropicalis NBRC 101654]
MLQFLAAEMAISPLADALSLSKGKPQNVRPKQNEEPVNLD